MIARLDQAEYEAVSWMHIVILDCGENFIDIKSTYCIKIIFVTT